MHFSAATQRGQTRSWKALPTRCLAGALIGAATLASAGAASAHVRIVRPAPIVRPAGWVVPTDARRSSKHNTVESANWSGYAVESQTKITAAQGSWVQPAVTCGSRTTQYSSFWVGIDGYASSSVEQLGTDSDCTGQGRASYYAWYEMYPANSVDLSTSKYPVKPGDTLNAEVSSSGSQFTLTISDPTESKPWTFSTTLAGSGFAQSSAELIAESPEICNGSRCQLAQLANFGTVNFSNALAALTGGPEQAYSALTYNNGPHEILAVNGNGTIRAQPSGLNGAGNAFSIAWKHD